MARTSKVDKQLDALAARFTPRIKKAFLASVADIKDKAVIGAITDAIQVGDLEAAFRATGLSPAAMRPITQMIETAFETGGVTVANSAPRGITDSLGNRAVFRFDVRNSRSEAWLRDHSSSLVTRITDDTRGNIRTIIQRGVAEGRNPRNIALDIVGRINPDTGRRTGGVIGLTAPQEQWVGNARRDLNTLDARYFTREARDKRFDSIVRKAIDGGKPLPAAKVNAIIDKYSDNLLLQRGETIARTEAIQSLNRAADDAFRQAIDEGTLAPSAVTKTWDSAGDARVRPSHRIMEGQAVKMDEPFRTPDGAQLMFPGDTSLGAPGGEVIACRCRVRYEVDWFADLDDDDATPAPPIPRLPDVPEPAPAPVNQFAYEDFVPLPNVAAAQAWAIENIAENVAFGRTWKVAGLNEILQATQEVSERFGLPKVRYIGDPKSDVGSRYRWSTKSNAAYSMSNDAYLFQSVATDVAKLTERKAIGQTERFSAQELPIAKAVVEQSRFIGPEVKSLISRMTEYFWSANSAGTPRATAYHEMGHRLHALNRTEIDAIFRKEWQSPTRGGWGYLVSKYSRTNDLEYVAETFSIYMQGDESQFWRIMPELLELYKAKDRKNVRT